MGRDFPHFTNIYPFYDAPTVPIQVLFYPLPLDQSAVPFDNPFTLRNWDRLEGEAVPVVGTRYDPKTYYTGPLPLPTVGQLCGTADMWKNGLSYAVYLAGGYSCLGCPPVFPDYVQDIFSPLNSIIVNPHKGHVLEDLNLMHTNSWLVTQEFSPGAPSQVAIRSKGVTGQTGDYFQVLDEHGTVALQILPALSTNETPRILGNTAASGNLLFITNSTLLMRDAATAATFLVSVAPIVQMSFPQLWMRASGTNMFVGASVALGAAFSSSHPLTPAAELECRSTGPMGIAPIMATTDFGTGPVAVFQCDAQGNGYFFGGLGVNAFNNSAFSMVYVVPHAPGVAGILIHAVAGQTAPLLQILGPTGNVLFSVGGSAGLATAGLVAATGPVGTIIGKLPVQNSTGSITGFIPVYDTIT